MRHLKTYENFSGEFPVDGMDDNFYHFLKEKFKGTKYGILYTVGYDTDDVEHISFVEDDGFEDDDFYVSINDLTQPKMSKGGITNTYIDFYANEFNVNALENDDSIFGGDADEDYAELGNFLTPIIEEYKTTEDYHTYNIKVDTKKFNL